MPSIYASPHGKSVEEEKDSPVSGFGPRVQVLSLDVQSHVTVLAGHSSNHTTYSVLVLKFALIPLYMYIYIQVATALLVAGSTLTFWIPWQTWFASTSSYSSIVQSARLFV